MTTANNDVRPLAGLRIVVAVTAASSASFYEGQLAALRRAGAHVHFIASPSDEVARQCADEGVTFVPIPMERAPAPWRDAHALMQVTAALARIRPDVVNAGTPKAGLLGMLAAAAVRVPTRVHTVHGLRYETASGPRRRLLWMAQRTSCAAATHVVCVGPSLHARSIQTGLFGPTEGVVIGDGSVNGVDIRRFRRNTSSIAQGTSLRRRLGIPVDAPVVGYIGRLSRDKGIGDLAAAWRLITGRGCYLILAGVRDETDPPSPRDLAALLRAPDVRLLGHIDDPVAFYASIDLLVLPSWREGFPTVTLEAGAMGLPVVATCATGCVDAVVDGLTGTLVPVSEPQALARAVDLYVHEPALRLRHGTAGRTRIVERFTRERVHRLTVDFYSSIVRRS